MPEKNKKSKKIIFLCCVLFFQIFYSHSAGADFKAGQPFIPEQPVIEAGALRAGDTGYLLTVLQGMTPVKIPVRVVSVIPQKGEVKNLILVRLLSSSKIKDAELARGMSGSPVYIKGKLAGAIGSGWEFSDHTLALVTPISDMCAVFSREARGTDRTEKEKEKKEEKNEKNNKLKNLNAPVAVSGLSGASAAALGALLGVPLAEAPAGSSGELLTNTEEAGRLEPGDSVAAVLAWGDIDVAATGTVTATSKDGRFLAFGHPFLKRGNAGYPAARAYIHETVKTQLFPFKLASPTSIVGTVTQDREAGIGGRMNYFAPSIPASMIFRDLDLNRRDERKFRVIADDFLSAKLLEGIYAGILDDAWGRRGQGTMKVTLRLEGRGIHNGWTRSDIFFSDENVAGAALKQTGQILSAFLTQPFSEEMPVGVRLEVEATETPRALIIEDVKAPSSAEPGEEIPVTVTLRPWRGQTVTRRFKLKVPEGASGVCELIVRGGGVHPLTQLALEGGWKSIDSLERLLKEIAAMDANNELIIELLSDSIADVIKKASENKDDKNDKDDKDGHDDGTSPELLPEETEYLSETKERRIKEGTLRVFRSDRLVDGMMKRLVTVDKAGKVDKDGAKPQTKGRRKK